MADSSTPKDIADAVKGIVQAVPVYQDVVQPAAQEIGKALQTVAKTVHIALAPVSALVWGYEHIKEFVATQVAGKLKNVPPERIITPKPNVAGPAIEALRYTGHDETLRDMYANLLATSMDAKTASGAHPAFVEIIKQLTPDEAKVIKYLTHDKPFPIVTVGWEHKVRTPEKSGGREVLEKFSLIGEEAGCEFPALTPSYITNIQRLGIAVVPTYQSYTGPGVYAALERHPVVLRIKASIESDPERKFVLTREMIQLTPLGKQFCAACVLNHDELIAEHPTLSPAPDPNVKPQADDK